MKSLFVVMALLLTGIGCSLTTPLPPIKGYHWTRKIGGASLFNDSNGAEAASWLHGIGAVQVCPFDKVLVGCHYFETDKQALDWLAKLYEAQP